MTSLVLLLVAQGTEGAQEPGSDLAANLTSSAAVPQQFELDIEPKVFLKPSRMSSTEALAHNESQEFSFSEAATKGMQPLRETVSEFEMLARAGKDNLRHYLCSLLSLHLPCTSPGFPGPALSNLNCPLAIPVALTCGESCHY